MRVIKILVKEGKLIRDPRNNQRLEPGRDYNVPATQYWLKRLKEKDVEYSNEKSKPIRVKDIQPKFEKKEKKENSKIIEEKN